MLIIKEPIKLNCKEPIHTANEGFCHRITDNYHLMTSNLEQEELLHMVTNPPEIYLAGEENSQIINQTLIFNQKEMKVEMINNLLNRLSMSQEVYLTYQDKVYIDNVLRKLGIKNTASFIEEVNKQKIWNESQEKLIRNYWTLMENYHNEEESGDEVKKILNQRLEEQNEEYHNYLHESIMNRLRTGVIYHILENFNESNTYNNQWMEQQKINFAEQKKLSHQIFLNQMENYISEEQVPFIYLAKNRYEILDDEQGMGEEKINGQITRAVLFQLLNNIHMERISGNKKEEQLWINYQNSLYKSAENTIFRIKNNVHQRVEKQIERQNEERIQNNKTKFTKEKELLYYRENIQGNEEQVSQPENIYTEHYYDSKVEKNFYSQPEEMKESNSGIGEIEKILPGIKSEVLQINNLKKQITGDLEIRNTNEKDIITYHESPEKIETEQEINIQKQQEVSYGNITEEEINHKLQQEFLTIKERNSENNVEYNHYLENQTKATEEYLRKIEEYEIKKREDFSSFESINLDLKPEITESEAAGDAAESGGMEEKRKESSQEKEAERQIYEKLQEINKKNLENLVTYQKMMEEKRDVSKVNIKTVEERRNETLKALYSPNELMLEYKKEADQQEWQQEEIKRQIYEHLPEETRRIYEIVEAYQQSDKQIQPVKGVIKNDYKALQADTALVLKQEEYQKEVRETMLIREQEETEKKVEHWNSKPQQVTAPKEKYGMKNEVSMVHKQIQQSIEEEVLEQLLEENRSLIQKQTRNEIVNKEQVQVTRIENREEKQMIQKNMQDITEMINQGVKRQIGTISDQVYHRLEKKLSNEKKRRGF